MKYSVFDTTFMVDFTLWNKEIARVVAIMVPGILCFQFSRFFSPVDVWHKYSMLMLYSMLCAIISFTLSPKLAKVATSKRKYFSSSEGRISAFLEVLLHSDEESNLHHKRRFLYWGLISYTFFFESLRMELMKFKMFNTIIICLNWLRNRYVKIKKKLCNSECVKL